MFAFALFVSCCRTRPRSHLPTINEWSAVSFVVASGLVFIVVPKSGKSEVWRNEARRECVSPSLFLALSFLKTKD